MFIEIIVFLLHIYNIGFIESFDSTYIVGSKNNSKNDSFLSIKLLF